MTRDSVWAATPCLALAGLCLTAGLAIAPHQMLNPRDLLSGLLAANACAAAAGLFVCAGLSFGGRAERGPKSNAKN